jgi:hypothetical protein
MNGWVIENVRAMRFSERERFWRALEARIPRASTGERVAWPHALLHLSDLDWEEALRATSTSSAATE